MKAPHADLYYPVFYKNKPRECHKLAAMYTTYIHV